MVVTSASGGVGVRVAVRSQLAWPAPAWATSGDGAQASRHGSHRSRPQGPIEKVTRLSTMKLPRDGAQSIPAGIPVSVLKPARASPKNELSFDRKILPDPRTLRALRWIEHRARPGALRRPTEFMDQTHRSHV